MKDLGPLIVLLVVIGIALTVVCGIAVRIMHPDRRVRAGLKKVLRVDPHALIISPGRGKGVGFNFTSNDMAVAWDAGAWCLMYRLDELMGAETIVDGQVAARVHRGEPRRALENVGTANEVVRLRLIFDDPSQPDFLLDLWLPADVGVRGAFTAPDALAEANRWIARVDALLRRPTTRRPSAPPPKPVEAPPAQQPAEPEPALTSPPPPAPSGFMSPLRADDLPWEDGDDHRPSA